MSNVVSQLISPINKLIGIAEKAIGKAYEPTHIKRIAKAQAEVIDIYADALRRNQDVLGELKFEGKGVNAELVKRAFDRNVYQEILKQTNIESVLGKAYDELKDAEDCSSEPVNDDWILRFFKKIEDVSDNDMQLLWAKILADEIKQPKSFSLRTLEVVSNLTHTEAMSFLNLAKFVVKNANNYYIIDDPNFIESNNINLTDIIIAEDCGLLNLNRLVINKQIKQNDKDSIFCNENYVVFCENNTKELINFSINVYKLTNAGQELYNILNIDYNLQFFEKLIDYYHTCCNWLDIGLYNVHSYQNENEVQYYNKPIYQKNSKFNN